MLVLVRDVLALPKQCSVTRGEMLYLYIAFCSLIFQVCLAFPEQGVWHFTISEHDDFVAVSKVVQRNSTIFIRINCDTQPEKLTTVNISYSVWMLPCYEKGFEFDNDQDILVGMRNAHNKPELFPIKVMPASTYFFVMESPKYQKSCGKHNTITLESIKTLNFIRYPPVSTETVDGTATNKTHKSNSTDTEKSTEIASRFIETRKRDTAASESEKTESPVKDTTHVDPAAKILSVSSGDEPQVVLTNEGIYIVTVLVTTINDGETYNGTIAIKIRGPDGYLSAVDWPLLPFYGTMCVVFVIYGIVWLVVSACQWRDLLRIQFWIGGVIFLGMLEKAVYYAEYQSIDSTGKSVQGAVICAEIVSCLKRTLARMLVIIVSLGFGIVKPRLGPLLHRVVGVGGLYFVLSVIECFTRINGVRSGPYKQFWLATILLAVLDSFICWWIFTSLVQTTRTLRLRRNIVKLSLYRHFTNTLIFAVIASVAFMVWSLRTHQGPTCIEAWKELWVDEAYWRLLFSIILLVIMILWRPTNNNQRYAFMPLLDAPDDEDDEQAVPDSFEGMKMRGVKNQNHHSPKGVEDDLKWIDENIPSAISDVALPSLLDSDEEIMTTKFEMSKMN